MNKFKIPFSLCGAALITILLTTAALPQRKTAGLSDEQRDALREYFETNDKLASFGSKPLELLNKPALNDFFSQYGNALLMVRIGNDLQTANDWDALKKVFEKLGEEAIKKISPDFAKAFGWFGWPKVGMELLKKFAYDPGVTNYALDFYATRRREGADPDDASVSIPWGPMRTLALEQFLKQYNKDLILEKGSKDKLSPVWEKKLDRYLNAWLEDLYQERLANEAKQRLLAQAARAKQQVPSFDQHLLEVLHKETPTANFNLAGTYKTSVATFVLSGSGQSLTAEEEWAIGGRHGHNTWHQCKVTEATVTCRWTGVYRSDPDKTADRKGTVTATLSGNRLTGAYTEEEPTFQWKVAPYSSAMRNGAIWRFDAVRQ